MAPADTPSESVQDAAEATMRRLALALALFVVGVVLRTVYILC
jgi:hypothetical protein